MADYQAVVDLAREPLNDEDKVRFPDATLLLYAVHGMQQIVKRRPDLFVGQFGTLPSTADTLVTTFPLGDEYIQTLADYIVARASTHSDEHITTGRAQLFAELFGGDVPI